MSKEIPILFSTHMVNSILVGRKTKTRRLNGLYLINESPSQWKFIGVINPSHKQKQKPVFRFENTINKELVDVQCPYGEPGNILWVRESWRKYYHVDEQGYTHFDKEIIEFAADNPQMILQKDGDGFQVFNKDGSEKFIPFKPSIHMLKSDARIWLEFTDVRVERLQGISPGDACDEGVNYFNIDPEAMEGGELQADFENYTWTEKRENDPNYEDRYFPTFANPVDSFRTLWQSINGYESWQSNPWVWVVSFKLLSKSGKPANI